MSVVADEFVNLFAGLENSELIQQTIGALDHDYSEPDLERIAERIRWLSPEGMVYHLRLDRPEVYLGLEALFWDAGRLHLFVGDHCGCSEVVYDYPRRIEAIHASLRMLLDGTEEPRTWYMRRGRGPRRRQPQYR